jgi:RNA polymerase subunit RPABC4/transcription elongation factor Spt4
MKSKDSICPVCEEYSFEFPDDYDICPVCGWENDGLQRNQKDYCGGANHLSANDFIVT